MFNLGLIDTICNVQRLYPGKKYTLEITPTKLLKCGWINYADGSKWEEQKFLHGIPSVQLEAYIEYDKEYGINSLLDILNNQKYFKVKSIICRPESVLKELGIIIDIEFYKNLPFKKNNEFKWNRETKS